MEKVVELYGGPFDGLRLRVDLNQASVRVKNGKGAESYHWSERMKKYVWAGVS